jgi:phosphoserine phosphatase RsbU/P
VTPSLAGAFRFTRLRALLLGGAVLDGGLIFTGKLAPLSALLTFILVSWGSIMVFRMLLRRTRLIWYMRNRLIVTYMFIAVVPIALILALFSFAGWFLTGQFAGYLVSSALERRGNVIEAQARLLARSAPPDRTAIAQDLAAMGISPFEALVTGPQPFRYPAGSKLELPPDGWNDYTGIVYKGNEPYLVALVHDGAIRAEILAPLTSDAVTSLVPGLGTFQLPLWSAQHADVISSGITLSPGAGKKNVITIDGKDVAVFGSAIAGSMPPAYNALDVNVQWWTSVNVAGWDEANSNSSSLMIGNTRLSAVLGIIFPGKIESSELYLYAFYLLIGLLGVAELISLFIGVSMTRTITGAVHNLYEGTMKVSEGDFAHRMPVKGRDQLAELGSSFNKMAGQLEHLVTVAREKERLQSEIAIASEVQTQLFPRKPPASKTLSMLGVCHAARMVSGDYYDYFEVSEGKFALALGDVAGKGISAALLMASIQSIMRTQLSSGEAGVSPAVAVARLNRLLYASTSAEKYATFFFGLYDTASQSLLYTNAGHLPPLVIRANGWEFLEVTGSVVGAFPSLKYEERTIPLGPGELLIAYTDGITEPENAYGEDFGAERLAEIVMRHRDAALCDIVERILEAVRQWSPADEQADDMTIMVARGLA